MAKRKKKEAVSTLDSTIKDAEIEITQVLFQNEKSWCIVLFDTNDVNIQAYIHKGVPPKAVGVIENAEAGNKYVATMKVELNAYGYQFNIRSITPAKETAEVEDTLREEINKLEPRSKAVALLLANGFIPYVGPAATLAAVRKYGNTLYRIIFLAMNTEKEDEDPFETVADHIKRYDIDIFGNRKADESFVANFNRVKKYVPLNAFFQGYMSYSRIKKLYDLVYNRSKNVKKTIEKLKTDPFMLVGSLRGFTYRYMNDIIKQLNLPNYSEIYFKAAVQEALRLLSMEGSCFGSEQEILAQLQELLQVEEIDMDQFENTLCELIEEKRIVVWDNDIYLHKMFCDEQVVGMFFSQSDVMAPTCSDKEVEKLIADEEELSGFTYEETQKQAVRTMNHRRVSVVTGGPGTGKSTVIKLLVKLWLTYGGSKDSVVLLAPTGKAAQRMADIVGIEAFTIHKWIGKQGDIVHDTKEMLNLLQHSPEIFQEPEKLIIVDETSMLDINVAAWLVRAVGFNAKIVLVGDNDQLPSIGPGYVFGDLMKNLVTTRLKIQHRSVPSITWNASRFNAGSANDIMEDEHFHLICLSDEQDPAEAIKEEYKKLIDKYGLENVGLLCPKRKESSNPKSVTAGNLNKYFQNEFKKPDAKKVDRFYVGDRVIQCRNNYNLKVFNGEVGTITDLVMIKERPYVIVTMDGDKREVLYSESEIEDLDLAYAISVHKSQGSEFAACVVPVLNADIFMLQRNLIYTGVTRCKQEVVLITNNGKKPLRIGVYKNPVIKRNSNLSLYFK